MLTPIHHHLLQGSLPISLECLLSQIAHEQFPTPGVRSHHQSPANSANYQLLIN